MSSRFPPPGILLRRIIVAERMSAAGKSTLLIEGGGPSYGITGGDLNIRRPVCTSPSSGEKKRVFY